MSGWQKIETAPKDGTWIIVSEPSGTWMDFVRWSEGSWRSWPTTIFGGGEGDSPAAFWLPISELPWLPEEAS